jgi:hypothetical protein
LKKRLRQLFDKRNLLAILTILIGLLGLFGLPQQLGFTDTQLILGLLTFLALEAVIINLGYLENLQTATSEIQAKVVHPGLDHLFAPRDRRFELADFAPEATEILILGVSLESFVMHQTTLFTQLASRNCRLHFIVVDPAATFLDAVDMDMPNHVGQAVLKANIQNGLSRLSQLYKSLTPSQRRLVAVRQYAGVPFYSAVKILTRSQDHDTIWVSFYSYGTAVAERRGIRFTAATSPANFTFYRTSLDRLWAAARPVDLETLSV